MNRIFRFACQNPMYFGKYFQKSKQEHCDDWLVSYTERLTHRATDQRRHKLYFNFARFNKLTTILQIQQW